MCDHHWEIQLQQGDTLHLQCTKCGYKTEITVSIKEGGD